MTAATARSRIASRDDDDAEEWPAMSHGLAHFARAAARDRVGAQRGRPSQSPTSATSFRSVQRPKTEKFVSSVEALIASVPGSSSTAEKARPFS